MTLSSKTTTVHLLCEKSRITPLKLNQLGYTLAARVKQDLDMNTNEWMYGPFFRHENEKCWPPVFCQASGTIICEMKYNIKSLLVSVLLPCINYRNSFKTLQQIICNLCKDKINWQHQVKLKV